MHHVSALESGVYAVLLLYKHCILPLFALCQHCDTLPGNEKINAPHLLSNADQLKHLSAYICMYLSACVISSIASALNVLCWFHRGRHHGHLSWHWEPQWEALYPHLCGPFAETGLPMCCAQSPRGLAEHWAHLPSHVHLRYETFMHYDEQMCLSRKCRIYGVILWMN